MSRAIGIGWALLLGAVMLAALAAVSSGRLTLDELRAGKAALAASVEAAPVLAAALFLIAVIAATALCFPVAPLIGVSGGALFGGALGFVLTLAGTVIGSTIAFAAARRWLRGHARARFERRMAMIDGGMVRHGGAYLLALRFNPLIPYWPVNLAMGVTAISWRRFVPLTAIGLAPSIATYAIAGTHLAELRTLRDLATPEMLAALLVFSLAPFAAQALLRRRQRSSTSRP